MPNQVSYYDEKTMAKVIRAMVGDNNMDISMALDAVSRLQNAGILFREGLPKESTGIDG